jgi:hypothetical protein
MFVKQVSEPIENVEVFADVMEDIFAHIEGAYEYEVVGDEQIQSLHKRVLFITNEEGEKIAEVEVKCYPNGDGYTVEVELVEGK